MQIELWWVGKTKESYLNEGIKKFTSRIGHYCTFKVVEFPDVKKTKLKSEIINQEGKQYISKIKNGDKVILMDERGKQKSSIQLSKYLEEHQNYASKKKIVIIIGGAFGLKI